MFKLLQRLIQLFSKGGTTPAGKMIARDISKSQKLKEFKTMLERNVQYETRYKDLMQQGKKGKAARIKFIKDYLAGRKKMSDYVKPTSYEKKWGVEQDWHKKPVGW
jgi:hypothetical protein